MSPHPKSLSQGGRGTLNPAPLLPFWEEGLGDEGHEFAKVGCPLPFLKIAAIDVSSTCVLRTDFSEIEKQESRNDADTIRRLGITSMDYQTARELLQQQGNPSNDADAFLVRLQQGKAPVPGQVTNLLLALKVVFERLNKAEFLDRELVYALYVLAIEGRRSYDNGRQQGVAWPPLLDEDLTRMAIAVKSIFLGQWLGS